MELTKYQQVQIFNQVKVRTKHRTESALLFVILETLGYKYKPMGNNLRRDLYSYFFIRISPIILERQVFATNDYKEWEKHDFLEITFDEFCHPEKLVRFYKGLPCVIRRKVTSNCYYVEMLKNKMLNRQEVRCPQWFSYYATESELKQISKQNKS